jgi:hypothetical protein
MDRRLLWGLAALAVVLAGAEPPHAVRSTGTVQAVHSLGVQTASIRGQGGNLTLVRLIANGVTVHKGDILAEFDATSDRDRGELRGSPPPTPPCVRVRTRRFESVTLTLLEQ